MNVSDFKLSPEQELRLHVREMYEWTVAMIRHARDLANAGKKDAARNYWRFLFNGRFVEVACSDHVGVISQIEAQKIRSELWALKGECHPFEAADYETDIQAIRASLDKILLHLNGGAFEQKDIGDL